MNVLPNIVRSSQKIKLDREDRHFLALPGWVFHNAGDRSYIRRRDYENQRVTYLHRLVVATSLARSLRPGEVIDHVNGNTFDNRRKNLRVCSTTQNLQHRVRIPSSNKSGVLGVHRCKKTKKWATDIRVNGRRVWLGRFASLSQARKARRAAENKFFKKFAPNRKALP